ncbi:MAG: hypothetical protein JOY94_18805, partial [Methylobacteriaceae bacterium]|nr:hypothetical protein [Methylobacteriaceae bacterium]
MSLQGLTRRALMSMSTALVASTVRLQPASAQQQVALRVSTSDPIDENANHYVWFEKFAASLKTSVGDRIRLDLFPNSQLGKEADVVQQVKIGSTD